MKNRYVRYILYSIAIMVFGFFIDVMGIPDLFKFSEWCELGYRSRESMITMSFCFVIMGAGLFIFGSALFIYSFIKYSTFRQELAKVRADNFSENELKITNFEKALILFLSLSIVIFAILHFRVILF